MSPTAANLAAAIENTLDDLGIRRFHVAGYSLGARVAIQLAGSKRVRSLIFIAPDGLGTPAERLQGFVALVAGSECGDDPGAGGRVAEHDPSGSVGVLRR